MTQSLFTCSACGLLCTARSEIDASIIQQCPVRLTTLRERDISFPPVLVQNVEEPTTEKAAAERIHYRLKNARRPLVLIDGADVLTARKAIELAFLHSASVFVPYSAGSRVVKHVEISDGWLGTTLADMACHSELVISLGTRWQSRTPELASRWICGRIEKNSEQPAAMPNRRWWHLGEEVTGSDSVGSDHWLKLPKSAWNQLIANVTLQVSRAQTKDLGASQHVTYSSSLVSQSNGNRTTQTDDIRVGETELAAAILNSNNTTIVWETSEMQEPKDEIFVHRLWKLAQVRSQRVRCNLLAISADPGRETARQTLLWMTGCDSIAFPSGCGWKGSDRLVEEDDGEWLGGFDAILLIRNTPVSEPNRVTNRNNTPWDIGLCDPAFATSKSNGSQVIPVGLVGFEDSGFLMRGDNGMTQFVSPTSRCLNELGATSGTSRFSAHQILMQACEYALNQTDCVHPSIKGKAGRKQAISGNGKREPLP